MTVRELIALLESAAEASPNGLDERVLIDHEEGAFVYEISADVDFDPTGGEIAAVYIETGDPA